jgi:hypothetical protein
MNSTKKELDYNTLLNDWAEELFKVADNHAKKKRQCRDRFL